MEKPYWEGKHYAFFSNKECEYFPCHAGADPENFNCLFLLVSSSSVPPARCISRLRNRSSGLYVAAGSSCSLLFLFLSFENSRHIYRPELRLRNREIQRAGGTDEEDTRRKRRIMI